MAIDRAELQFRGQISVYNWSMPRVSHSNKKNRVL